MSTKMGYEDATIDGVLGSRRRRCQIREMARARAGEEIDARELMGMKASKEKISVVFTDSPS